MTGRISRAINWLALGLNRRGRVLDLGSGNAPHPRADVLCDRYLQPTGHRRGAKLVEDRPLVCADIAALPFPAGAFSFLICRMLVEHLSATDLAGALREMMRVACGGYIEAPSPVCELLMPDPHHAMFVELAGSKLIFTPKSDRFPEPAVAACLLGWRRNLPAWRGFMMDHDGLFTTRFEWTGSIPYEIRPPASYPESLAPAPTELEAMWARAEPADRTRSARQIAKATARTLFKLPVLR